jgi:hypothetical protein
MEGYKKSYEANREKFNELTDKDSEQYGEFAKYLTVGKDGSYYFNTSQAQTDGFIGSEDGKSEEAINTYMDLVNSATEGMSSALEGAEETMDNLSDLLEFGKDRYDDLISNVSSALQEED